MASRRHGRRSREAHLDYAFDQERDITACPTNVGTRMRAAMLHLPALKLVNQVNHVLVRWPNLGWQCRGFTAKAAIRKPAYTSCLTSHPGDE